MSIDPQALDSQERGLALQRRGRKADKSAEDAPELKSLRDRIEALKKANPRDPVPHCSDCYRRGWFAALRALEEV